MVIESDISTFLPGAVAQVLGEGPVGSSPLPGGGSDRRYWRLSAPAENGDDGPPAPPRQRTAILMEYTDARPDNLSFLPAASFLSSHGVAIPAIWLSDEKHRKILLEDVGDVHLWDFRDDDWETRRDLYRATLDEAAKIHRIPESALPSALVPQLQSGFDEDLYAWERHYFIDQFLLRFSDLSESERAALMADPEMTALGKRLASQERFLVHRDFQSQNVLIRDGKAVIIDFQGLRGGRPEYDIASLLFDPYVSLTREESSDLIDYAYHAIAPEEGKPALKRDLFSQNISDAGAQRLMQALGAYAYLSEELGKTRFLEYIPRALENLRAVVADLDGQNRLGCLSDILHSDRLRHHGSDEPL